MTQPALANHPPPFDIHRVRSHFPGLSQPIIYFDNAGGSQTLGTVVSRISDYLCNTNVQLGASYTSSVAASERVAQGVRAVGSLFGEVDEHEVVLGSSSTQLIFNLAAALAPTLHPGDEVIVTAADHEANIGAWRRLSKRGISVKEWPVNRESYALEMESLEPLLSARTKWVALTHCSNVIGTIHHLNEISQRVHACGARLFVDGVAFAPHAQVDVHALGVDGYVFSLYKVYGPHLGAMWLKRDLLDEIACINHDFLAAYVPYKIQPGGANYELTWGAGAIAGYLDELGAASHPEGARAAAWSAIAAQEQALSERFLSFLRHRKGVKIIGDPQSDRNKRVPTISFVSERLRSSEVPPLVDPYGIGIRYGDFYARHLIDALDLRQKEGVVRVSMVHYNLIEEVDKLIEVLDRVLPTSA